MPVQTIPAGPRAAARFIVCDKRSDINRVALTRAHVDQWKCDGEALARFVVAQLGLRRSRHSGQMILGRGPSGSPPATRGTRCWASARTGT